MRLNIKTFFFFVLFNLVFQYSYCQIFDNELSLFNQINTELKNHKKLLVGLNTQYGGFKYFDNLLIQIAGRYKPFIKDNNKIFKNLEAGINLDGFFNKNLYSIFDDSGIFWIFGSPPGPKNDTFNLAIDGYCISTNINEIFIINNFAIEIGFAPKVSIIDKNEYYYEKGKNTIFGYTGYLAFSYKKWLYLSATYKRNSNFFNFHDIRDSYIKPINNSRDSYFVTLFDENKLKFNISLFPVINKNYTIHIYNSYSFYTIYEPGPSLGFSINSKRMIINPELKLITSKFNKLTQFDCTYYGLLFGIKLNKNLIIKSSIQKTGYFCGKFFQANLGIQTKF